MKVGVGENIIIQKNLMKHYYTQDTGLTSCGTPLKPINQWVNAKTLVD